MRHEIGKYHDTGTPYTVESAGGFFILRIGDRLLQFIRLADVRGFEIESTGVATLVLGDRLVEHPMAGWVENLEPGINRARLGDICHAYAARLLVALTGAESSVPEPVSVPTVDTSKPHARPVVDPALLDRDGECVGKCAGPWHTRGGGDQLASERDYWVCDQCGKPCGPGEDPYAEEDEPVAAPGPRASVPSLGSPEYLAASLALAHVRMVDRVTWRVGLLVERPEDSDDGLLRGMLFAERLGWVRRHLVARPGENVAAHAWTATMPVDPDPGATGAVIGSVVDRLLGRRLHGPLATLDAALIGGGE